VRFESEGGEYVGAAMDLLGRSICYMGQVENQSLGEHGRSVKPYGSARICGEGRNVFLSGDAVTQQRVLLVV
jgi:hypothetical protein